jgi:hypothetical protein
MGAVLALDILQDVSFALIEPIVATTLNPSGLAITPGIQTVTPGSMVGIYAGALLAIGANGAAAQEAITVTSVTTTTFTATFLNPHPNTEPVNGATFPSGIPESTLFSTAEVLGYIADSQNDFLLQVRPIYATAPLSITPGIKVYQAPADAIRVERASIVNVAAPSAVELWNTTQIDLDLEDSGWPGDQGPTSWYQDQLTYQTIGFGPPPNVGNTVTLMYSQKAVSPLNILSTFLVPDPMTVAIKWRTLALCYSKDGEMRNPQLAAFAQSLYGMLCEISKKFMEGIDARMKAKEETVEPLAAQRF